MGKKSSDDSSAKRAKGLGIATVVKPCMIGATLLSVAMVALPH